MIKGLNMGLRTLAGLTWSIFCCTYALLLTLWSEQNVPFVLRRIGSDLWSKYMLFIAGNRTIGITSTSENSRPENLPSRAIFVSNHTSQLDINAASYAIPHPIVFLAKKSVRKVPILGLLNERVGTVFIDRSDQKDARQAVFRLITTLDKGISVLVFPEGTRSESGELGSFKKGAFHLALKAGVPIVPMHIHGTRYALPKKSIFIRSNPIHVRFGNPIFADSMEAKSLNEMVTNAEDAIRGMQSWHKSHVKSPD
ncbi:MAG: lysophospholipid acyltransferase family protein [Flavobacteriales bacterium]